MKSFHSKRLLFVCLLVFTLALFALPALAQDVPVSQPTLTGAQAELEAALTALLELVSSVTYLPLAAGFVVVATALLKKVMPKEISAGAIALTLQVLVWAAFVVAKQAGYEGQFTSGLQALTTILGALAGLVGSSYVATKVYNKSVEANVPLIGQQR